MAIITTPRLVCDPCGEGKCKGTNVKTRYYVVEVEKSVPVQITLEGGETEEATETVTSQEIRAMESCDEKWAPVTTATAKFGEISRVSTLGASSSSKTSSSGSGSGKGGNPNLGVKHDNEKIRQWASVMEIKCSERGAIGGDVLKRYYTTFPDRKPADYVMPA